MIELKIKLINFELEEKKDHHLKVSFTAYQIMMVPMLNTMFRLSNGPKSSGGTAGIVSKSLLESYHSSHLVVVFI